MNGVDIFPLVISDIEMRARVGEKKYGECLKAFNGRNSLQDAYEEALDLSMYLKQRLVEEARLTAEVKELKAKLAESEERFCSPWQNWHEIVFVRHIETHLKNSGQVPMCRICDKTIYEIWEEHRSRLSQQKEEKK